MQILKSFFCCQSKLVALVLVLMFEMSTSQIFVHSQWSLPFYVQDSMCVCLFLFNMTWE